MTQSDDQLLQSPPLHGIGRLKPKQRLANELMFGHSGRVTGHPEVTPKTGMSGSATILELECPGLDWGVFQPLRDLVGMKVFSPYQNARPAMRLANA
jgi:hypothetical protein